MPRIVGDAKAPATTLPQDHFDRLYGEQDDPWGLSTKWYEQRKYAITAASLPRERYGNAFEPGCAVGELTRLLAPRCDRLLAVDFAASAVKRTREVVAEFDHVRVEQATLPEDLPTAEFDLIVASEILYYFSAEDLGQVLDGLVRRLSPGGDIVAAHWRASDRCYGYDGFNVHEALRAYPELTELVHHEDENFVLDVLRRNHADGDDRPTPGD